VALVLAGVDVLLNEVNQQFLDVSMLNSTALQSADKGSQTCPPPAAQAAGCCGVVMSSIGTRGFGQEFWVLVLAGVDVLLKEVNQQFLDVSAVLYR
jgi:hypothetical protein